jgi:hypothetical protein
MKKNIIALLCGIGLSACLFIPFEIFFRLNEANHWLAKNYQYYQTRFDFDPYRTEELRNVLKKSPVWNWKSSLSEDDPAIRNKEDIDKSEKGLLGGAHGEFAEEGVQRSKLVTSRSRKTIYDIKITFNQGRRRITPMVSGSKTQILMFGDSYTLGEGVENQETAPYFLSSLRPAVQIYNFGIPGGSPNHFLWEITEQSSMRVDSIPQKKSIILFTYMDDHLERLFCRSLCLKEENFWMLTQPHYRDENGRPVFQGSFIERHFLNFVFKVVNKSALLRHFDVVLPPFFQDRHFKFFASVMEEAKKKMLIKFPDSKFFVVFYPGASAMYAKELANACKARGLNVIDYSTIDTPKVTEGRWKIVGDGHPSPLTQYLFAHLLNQDLP